MEVECGNDLREEFLRASQDGDLNNVKNLVEVRHVDPYSCRDEQLRTPLHLASQHGHLDIVKYLVEERNCDVVCMDKYENTPLHLAALGGKLATVQYLISGGGCDPMCRGQSGRTPLHSACQGDRLDVVKYLIEDVKVDSSCQDVNDVTPLHLAALRGHLSVVKLLVEDYLCDPGAQNKNGETPADEAKRMGHTHITSYLSINALRSALEAQLEPYTRKATATGKVFGSGTYGSVIELTSAREMMAGKVFRVSSTAQMLPVVFRVCGELVTMVRLHHPNIVQCKGVSFLADQPLPVLLMERLMSSLHAYLLHPDNSNLCVERKVSILHDTASGLDYLHSQTPAIIHRDLTARNVLLDSQLTAKISDFGNSRIMDLDPEASPETLTPLPGTLEYMPPEAQGGSVAYDPSLDVFSFGHLSLFTVTQTPVRPLLPPSYSDSSGKLCARSEVKRRARFVEAAEQVLSENHSLVAVMKQCLHNDPAQRPHTGKLVIRLQRMVTPGSAASTPADTHSPSHGRGPVEADSETDNSPTEKSSSATGGHTADLRRALVARLRPYTRKATPTGKVLGSGTYGSVIELTSARETVAGKVFKMSSSVNLQSIANRVCGELITMVQLHHPNIVQCKGMSLLTDQPLPVLLMERMMSSLHDYLLHPDNLNLCVERKVSILRDTASGLDYLHSLTPAIVHRDLTAKNVLLDSQLRAKISDISNARIMDLDPEAIPETLTSLPGTLEYMPPEAQGGSVAYDPSLDVFSFGHLALFTVTQTPVRLLPATYHDHLTGKVHGQSEVNRRARFVEAAEQVLSENHSLVAVMKQCLHNNPAQRPHTGELVTRLQEMVTPGSAASTPADTHSPSHGREPMEVDLETDNSPTEKSSSATGGHTVLASSTTPHKIVTSSPPSNTTESACTSSSGSTSSRRAERPSLPVLLHFPTFTGDIINITNEVGSEYEDFGIFLLNDMDGEIVDEITEKHSSFEKIVKEILKHWIRGKGKEPRPVSWETLIDALNTSGLTELASCIDKSL